MTPEQVASRHESSNYGHAVRLEECETDGCWHAFCATCRVHLTPECEE